MSTDSGLPYVSIQRSLLSSTFNSSLLNILLTGIYTSVYIGTVYIYLTSRISRSYLVLSAITMLFILNVGQVAATWLVVNDLVGDFGETLEDVYVSSAFVPGWNVLLNDIIIFLVSAIADGLLIWRCYTIWDSSLRVILPSLVLLIAEIGLYMTLIVYACVQKLRPGPSAANILNALFGAALFTSLGTTLYSTLLIAYRIHSASRRSALNHVNSNARSFKHVLDLVVQSAAAYAFILAIDATLSVIPFNPTPTSPRTLYNILNYVAPCTPFAGGMAPTIMVARVALASPKVVAHPEMAHISGIEFHGVSTGGNMSHITYNIPAARKDDHT